MNGGSFRRAKCESGSDQSRHTNHGGVGREYGVGRGLGVTLGVDVGVGLAVGVAVGLGVGVEPGVAVGVGEGEGAGALYSSALVRTLVVPSPAATSTIPLDSKVAVCLSRGSLRLPVAVQLSLARSYNSALARTPLVPTPPAVSAMPLGSNVAV